MAILRSVDGQFYEIPDDQVAKFLIPADKVKDKVQGGADPGPPPGGPPPGGGGGPPPAIVVQIFGNQMPTGGGPPPTTGDAGAHPAGEVQPYAWWNTWFNTYRPGWHNAWHNAT
jgi:hypothetical protein